MKKPSDNWLSNLILVIQECEAETGLTFPRFCYKAFSGIPLDGPDHDLVKVLKDLK